MFLTSQRLAITMAREAPWAAIKCSPDQDGVRRTELQTRIVFLRGDTTTYRRATVGRYFLWVSDSIVKSEILVLHLFEILAVLIPPVILEGAQIREMHATFRVRASYLHVCVQASVFVLVFHLLGRGHLAHIFLLYDVAILLLFQLLCREHHLLSNYSRLYYPAILHATPNWPALLALYRLLNGE